MIFICDFIPRENLCWFNHAICEFNLTASLRNRKKSRLERSLYLLMLWLSAPVDHQQASCNVHVIWADYCFYIKTNFNNHLHFNGQMIKNSNACLFFLKTVLHIKFQNFLLHRASEWLMAHIFMQACAHIDGLLQERRNSSANALELRLSCPNPLNYVDTYNIKCKCWHRHWHPC